MGAPYATVQDIQTLIRPLTTAEQDKAESLLPIASAKLRIAASEYSCNIDQMIAANEDYGLVVREIVCKSVVRALDASAQAGPASVVSQESQSGLGYTASMTYLNAGQSLYYLRNELKDLGIMRQRYGALDLYGVEVTQDA
jgi:hypothetical protein